VSTEASGTTVELNSIEYDADDLSDALDQFEDADDGRHGYGVSGDVAVVGDGDPDDFVYVSRPNEVDLSNIESSNVGHGDSRPNESATHETVEELRDEIDSARTSDGTVYLVSGGSYGFKIPIDADFVVECSADSEGVFVAWHSDDDLKNDEPITGNDALADEGDYDSYAWVFHKNFDVVVE